MNFEDYETLPTANIMVHMTAGALAGVLEHCIMYPLDSVKTRMQSLAPGSTRDGVSGTFLKMVRHEGMFRPVRGMPTMILGAGPAHAFYFSSYEFLKSTLTRHKDSTGFQPVIYGVSGCISTILHDAIMNPAEVIKQRMQMENSAYTSAVQCMRGIYNSEGIRAFYRSYTTQLTMNIPYQSIHFMGYELAQRITNPERVYNPIAHMISGAAAGGVAAAITTPLDVCKTLLNTQQGGAATGLIQAIKAVYRLGGPLGYFRGMKARVIFQMPSTAICWSTYEFFKYFLSGGLLDGSVHSGTEEPPPAAPQVQVHQEKVNLKPRELPAMSGAGLYGSISFNTMHNADKNFARRTDSCILDINHT